LTTLLKVDIARGFNKIFRETVDFQPSGSELIIYEHLLQSGNPRDARNFIECNIYDKTDELLEEMDTIELLVKMESTRFDILETIQRSNMSKSIKILKEISKSRIDNTKKVETINNIFDNVPILQDEVFSDVELALEIFPYLTLVMGFIAYEFIYK